jgi:DNA-binding CsgD family transcriptional regulator/tetratricopeptide (TPR) repeat protein
MATASGRQGGATTLLNRNRECAGLDQLVGAVRAGEGRVLVMLGDSGVGKTVLLEYLVRQASGCRVVRATGVQSEMELAFAGLHQLCAPMLEYLGRLPVPQREALATAFGLSAGPPPDRFLVGLAVLSLLSVAAGERPLLCLVDDQQWLDQASAQALGFVGRRLAGKPVGLVFAARAPGAELAGLPELAVAGLHEDDARALLDSVLAGPLDARVRDQIVAETKGNPLALLELPRGLTPAQLAGGFGLPAAAPLPGRIEDSFLRQLGALPAPTGRLLLLAAADPSGDAALVWRAAERLQVPVQAARPAVEAGLAEFGGRVRFRHPLVRSAIYRSASDQDRRTAHASLAEVTDPAADPDRRAWHRAQAADGPDEEVAAELERSAGRALDRGGMAAAAAFLARSALLTPDPAGRARRLLAAVRANRDAGALDAALRLLMAAEAGPLDALGTAEAQRLRGQIASDQRRDSDAIQLLLSAARLFEPVDAGLARETYLEALWEVAMWTGELGSRRDAAQAARAAPPGPEPPRPVGVLLDALAVRFTDGYAAAAPDLTRALELFLTLDVRSGEGRRWIWLTGGRAGAILAMELWDFASWSVLAHRYVQVARDTGALVQLRFAINFLVGAQVLAGELPAAAALIEEDRLVAGVTGPPPLALSAMMLAAWRGQEAEASEQIEATVRGAAARGLGMLENYAVIASSVLHNGLGRYDVARDHARQAFERDHFGFGSLAVPELAEAAARTGELALVSAALDWLTERTSVTPTDWALGTEARVRALLSDDQAAERWYRESIERLERTEVRAQLARSHLLYGEWLRRQDRQSEARAQLRTAHQMLTAMGLAGFAERARLELLATGETVRRRTDATVTGLTAQEALIARLAGDGRTNTEIGAQLFLSARTVEWHLRKIFAKLGIRSRRELPAALAKLGPAADRNTTSRSDLLNFSERAVVLAARTGSPSQAWSAGTSRRRRPVRGCRSRRTRSGCHGGRP